MYDEESSIKMESDYKRVQEDPFVMIINTHHTIQSLEQLDWPSKFSTINRVVLTNE